MKINTKMPPLGVVLLILICLSACATQTSFVAENNQGPVILEIKDKKLGELPLSTDIRSTTFGRYDFKVSDDQTTLTGILPLKLRPGRIVLDALFYAPGLFFNQQSSCEKYTFDMGNSVVRCHYRDEVKNVKVKEQKKSI